MYTTTKSRMGMEIDCRIFPRKNLDFNHSYSNFFLQLDSNPKTVRYFGKNRTWTGMRNPTIFLKPE